MQTTNTALKQWQTRLRVSCFGIILGLPLLPVLLYCSYCWGLWGRHSLLLQYYFQCQCPAASEQARYPKDTEIVFSACRNVIVTLSPNGRRLHVSEDNSQFPPRYLLDLQTRERLPVSSDEGYLLFITDDLLLLQDGKSILDASTGKHYPIQSFEQLQPNAYRNGYANPELLANALSKADKVFLFDTGVYPVIALSADFQNHPERSFAIFPYDLEGSETDRLEIFLQQNNIQYYNAPPTAYWGNFPGEVLSADGRFIARKDGIYLVENNQRISTSDPRLLVRGWVDDQSVLYSAHHLQPCLLRGGVPFGDDSWCEIIVPQPVLLVRVPEQYLAPKQIK